MLRTLTLVVLSVAISAPLPAFRRTEAIDAEINAKIRKEGMESPHAMRTLHTLTDVYGPRLTGSPNLKNAGEWVVKKMTEWGFENAHLEPWDFGKPGWLNERLTAHITAPVKDHLVCEVLAWTPSTNGTVTGSDFQNDSPSETDAGSPDELFQHHQGTDPRQDRSHGKSPGSSGQYHATRKADG